MRRTDRLFELLQLFRGGRLRRGEDLARWLGVSLRTIYRDIETLIASGFPIEAERGLGFIVRQPIFLPPLNLTQQELEAFYLGMNLVRRAADKDLAFAAEALANKIEAVLPAASPRRDHQWALAVFTPILGDDVKWLPVLRAAVQHKRVVTIVYNALSGDETARQIYPLQIEFWGNVWTCTAWCEMREDFRIFRVDRISSCVTDDQSLPYAAYKSLTEFIHTAGIKSFDNCQRTNQLDIIGIPRL